MYVHHTQHFIDPFYAQESGKQCTFLDPIVNFLKKRKEKKTLKQSNPNPYTSIRTCYGPFILPQKTTLLPGTSLKAVTAMETAMLRIGSIALLRIVRYAE